MNQSGDLPADITAQLSSQHPRVMFRTPEEEEEEQEEIERPPAHRLGRLTIKYDRRELQRRLDIEQWMETELQLLFDCDQDFINDLLIRIRGLRRMKK
ncbi:hypothetical protein ABVT39_024455 [Epinephelus coioides]